MTPESKVKKEIKKLLDNYSRYGMYYFMPVPYGYGKQTVDFLGFFIGRGFAIEAKAPGEAPTPRQEIIIAGIRASHTPVFVIDGEAGLKELEAWLKDVCNS